MRLIDADALLDVVGKILVPYNAAYAAYQIKTAIDDAPTVDAVPVVHGRWIITEEYSTTLDCNCWRFTCSACEDYTVSLYRRREQNYCPNCGAKMDLEDEA